MAITTALLLVQWNRASLQPIIYLWFLFMAVSVAIIAHNHNHVPIWRSRFLNIVTDYWLTLFYGFPAFGWIPTHNKNHHFLNNKKGDYTITYRVSEKNNIFTLLSYPSISSYFQQKPIATYLGILWRSNRPKFYLAASQYLVLGLYYAVAIFVLNWKKAVLFIVIPHQVSLFSILIFNYVQHVHTDEESRYNHSRNFVGLINLALFNNGYHTIHHEAPGIHWSKTPAAQKKIQNLIDPSLNERSFWWFIFRVYLLAPFDSRFGTASKRLEKSMRNRHAATAQQPESVPPTGRLPTASQSNAPAAQFSRNSGHSSARYTAVDSSGRFHGETSPDFGTDAGWLSRSGINRAPQSACRR